MVRTRFNRFEYNSYVYEHFCECSCYVVNQGALGETWRAISRKGCLKSVVVEGEFS